MTRVVIALAWLVLGGVVNAQEKAVELSGRCGTDGRTLLDLKVDNDGVVSGTVFIYEGLTRHTAAVGTGTFDSKSSTLKLEGETRRPDGSALAYTIEARLDSQDKLRARHLFNGSGGEVTLLRLDADGSAATR